MRSTAAARIGLAGGLGAARGGVAALEFGIIAPVMAILTVGVFDLSKALILWHDTWSAARIIAESASTMAIQPDGSAAIRQTDAQHALSMIFAEMPWLRAGIATGNAGAGLVPVNTVSAVLSSVSYQPDTAGCKSSCNYVPVVQWSKAYVDKAGRFVTSSSVLRPCATVKATTQQTPGTPQTTSTVATADLKTGLAMVNSTQPDPFLIADVKLVYQPFMISFITGPVTFAATAYFTPRSNFIANPTAASSGASTPPSWVTYIPNAGGDPAYVPCGAAS